MPNFMSDVSGPEDICFQLLLPCLIPVLKEEFRNMYRTAATTNKALTNEEALRRMERLQQGRAPQDVMSLGLSFVRAPIMPKDFQKSLGQITKWNRFQVDELYDRVCLACGKQAMKMYIDALFYLKTQNLCWNANVDAAKIRITIPDYASFIHLITIHLARLLWELPGILEPANDYEQEYRRKDQFDHLVFQAVRLALAEKIPMSDILDQLSYGDQPMHHISSDFPYAPPPPPELITMPPIQQQPIREMHPIVPMQNGMPPIERFDPVIANYPQQSLQSNVPVLSEPPIRLLDEPRREEVVRPQAPIMTALPFENGPVSPVDANVIAGLPSKPSVLPPPPANPFDEARQQHSQHEAEHSRSREEVEDDDSEDDDGEGNIDEDDDEDDDDDEGDENDDQNNEQPIFHPSQHQEPQETNHNALKEPIKVHIV